NAGFSSTTDSVFLWDVDSGRRLNQGPMGGPSPLDLAVFSPNSARVLTCDWDGSARIWEARTGRAIGRPMRHRQRVTWGAFSEDRRQVVTASVDKSVRVWEAATGD